MAQGGRKVGRVIMARRGAVDDVVFVVFIAVVIIGLAGDVLLVLVLLPFIVRILLLFVVGPAFVDRTREAHLLADGMENDSVCRNESRKRMADK